MTCIANGRCEHYASDCGKYVELFLGRDILINPEYHKYKLTYLWNNTRREIVFMTRSPIDVYNLSASCPDANWTPIMFPIWHRVIGSNTTRKPYERTVVYVNRINDLLTSDHKGLLPAISVPCSGVHSLTEFTRQVLTKIYGPRYYEQVPGICYDMGSIQPQDIASFVRFALDCQSSELYFEEQMENLVDDWRDRNAILKSYAVYEGELDPIAMWFRQPHEVKDLNAFIGINYNTSILPVLAAQACEQSKERSSKLFGNNGLVISSDCGYEEFEAGYIDWLIDTCLNNKFTDVAFNVIGNDVSCGLTDRYMECRTIYETVDTAINRNNYCALSNNMIVNIITTGKDKVFSSTRGANYSLEKTWLEEVWIKDNYTQQLFYIDLVWWILAGSASLINFENINQIQ